jgi:predicted ATP-dependent serine protease
VFNGVSLDELLTKTSEADRLLVEPVDMGIQLAGGPLRGHNTIIFARPDVGKTACALTIAASALRQEKRVLYCGNEDPAEVMIERLISNLTNVPLNRLHLDPQRIMSVADSRGYQSFFFVEMYPGSASEIERHVQQVEPDVLIVDQLRNLKDKDTNRVIQLDTVARELRNLGKKYRLYNFALTQAGDSAENKLYLEMGDVDFSNTGIPGAADCMIGIGATREYIAQGHRMLSFPKNKIGGGSGREPVRVTLDVSRSKFV